MSRSGSRQGWPEEPAKPGRDVSRTALAVLIGLTAFWLTFNAVRPDPDTLDAAPAEILGVWTTEDERYAGRGFEIVPGEFRLQIGPHWAEVRAYPMREIKSRDVADGVEYEIHYATHEGDGVHVMTVDENGVARLSNPREVRWTRR